MTPAPTTTVETPTRHTSQVGNLTRDPQLRYSAKGTAWASCGLAVNRRRRREDGSFEELPAAFYDLVCFGELAEHVSECLHKGDRVVVVGRVETTGAGDEEKTKLVADDIGASLRFATATIERAERKRAPEATGFGFGEEPF